MSITPTTQFLQLQQKNGGCFYFKQLKFWKKLHFLDEKSTKKRSNIDKL
jgi:hypothetical protein